MSVFESLCRLFGVDIRPDDAPAINMPVELPMGSPGSPASRSAPPDPPIRLRPLTLADEDEWNRVRWDNADWLKPWDSGDPMNGASLTFDAWIRRQRRTERSGEGALFVVTERSRIVGQVSLGAVCYGSMRTGIVGYWIDKGHIGRGYAPLAVALLADWALLDPAGPRLHRLEIAILPENQRSKRVAEKLHARPEGIRARYMFINGRWRDHETYGLLAEDAPAGGFAARLMQERDGPTR